MDSPCRDTLAKIVSDSTYSVHRRNLYALSKMLFSLHRLPDKPMHTRRKTFQIERIERTVSLSTTPRIDSRFLVQLYADARYLIIVTESKQDTTYNRQRNVEESNTKWVSFTGPRQIEHFLSPPAEAIYVRATIEFA